MSRLNFITSGESHGKCLAAILEGMPSGVPISIDAIDEELSRRQQGAGRGGRMSIEKDKVEITAGVLNGKTTGAPIHLVITNKDFKIGSMSDLVRPRPGHADLAGALKYDQGVRPILERASARETAMRVAVGSVARQLLDQFKIKVLSHVIQIGSVVGKTVDLTSAKLLERKKKSLMNCADHLAEKRMIEAIGKAEKAGNTLGGSFQVRALKVPPGLGSHVDYRRKLDGRIAQGMMSLQSVKAVGIGLGREAAFSAGSQTQDAIYHSAVKGFYHKTNRAGGIEGGITNGEEILVTVFMKPISTLKRSLPSVDLKTRRARSADFERSDTCAVPAGSVVGEAILAFEIGDALLEKTGGDSLREAKRNLDNYLKQTSGFRPK
jgi:chorismate synthase